MSVGVFYVTTPIYYVNDVPHIGHAYTTIAADAIARYKRLKRYDVFFLTGTDEHGQKVEKSAKEAGIEPIELADRVVTRFQDLWKLLNISNDNFIRTTEQRHQKAVSHIWNEVSKNGDIYLGHYEDWYCTPCETFLPDSQLVDGNCPECNRPVERLKEESYFFALSKYGERILKHIEENPHFIEPESRKNEIVNFIKGGLRDLSISRTTFKWGLPVPGNPSHVIYVWFDALTNYLSATEYPDGEGYKNYWPAHYHIIGKDILRFHSVYWPAFLMSAGLKLPERVFAHGWWTVEGRKMSKSFGNVVDPCEVINDFGADQFRYFLLREVPFGHDGDFSIDALKGRINGDLANDLGNLVSRSVSMITKYRDGIVSAPVPGKARDIERSLILSFDSLGAAFDHAMDHLDFHDALIRIWAVVRDVNAYVDRSAPWKEEDAETLDNVLCNLASALNIFALYTYPFMPASADEIRRRIGLGAVDNDTDLDGEVEWATSVETVAGKKVEVSTPLFPRIELDT